MRVIFVILGAIILAGCESEAEEAARAAQKEYIAKMVVVRVCHDGTKIWQGPDGRRFTINFTYQSVSLDIPLKDVCD